MRTFKDIVNIFQSACDDHAGVNDFYYGSLNKLDSTSQNVQYNYVFLRPLASPGLVISSNGQAATHSLTFELYSLDVPKLTESDYLEVLSDTEIIIYDLISYFNLGTDQQNLYCTLNTIVPVSEGFNDRVFGWVATVTVNEPGVLDFCVYPTR